MYVVLLQQVGFEFFLDMFKCDVFTAASVLLHQISLKANRILLSTVSFRFVIPVTRCEDNIKMDLQEVEGGCGDGMELA